MLVLCAYVLRDNHHGHIMVDAESEKTLIRDFRDATRRQCEQWDKLKVAYSGMEGSSEPCWRRPTAATMTWYMPHVGTQEFGR